MFKLSAGIWTSARLLCASTGSTQELVVRMFYAVRKGRQPGVYNTWDECKEQVDRFAGAKYKKFASEEEALKFVSETDGAPSQSLHSNGPAQSASTSKEKGDQVKPSFSAKRPFQYLNPAAKDTSSPKRTKLIDISALPPLPGHSFSHMGDATVVYTDGCCSRNGRLKAKAGIGVYWGPSHPLAIGVQKVTIDFPADVHVILLLNRNLAERLEGRQTNQRAEIQAACKAIEQARSQNITKLVLYTDSMFTINGITKWVHTWKKNGWKLSTGAHVINRKDFEKLDRLIHGMDIKWMHIPGHAGFGGNEAADRLAREGAKKPEINEL